GHADENAPDEGLLCGGILSDHEQPGGAVQASAMEDRSPFDSEVGGGIDARVRVFAAQRRERLARVAGTEFGGHDCLPPLVLRLRVHLSDEPLVSWGEVRILGRTLVRERWRTLDELLRKRVQHDRLRIELRRVELIEGVLLEDVASDFGL